jgi:hypothetical protein
VYKGVLTETDYDSVAVAFLDSERNDLHRQDLSGGELNSLISMNPEDKFIQIWREYESDRQPVYWRVWPHSASKGWMERIEEKISYE